MADSKITQLTELVAPVSADLFAIVDDVAGVPETKKITFANTGIPLNTTHRTSDGTDHANVSLNDTHRTGDGSDHADVASNTSGVSTNAGNISTNTSNIAGNTSAIALGHKQLFMANDLSFSNNADWAVNGIAQLLPDSNNANYSSLRFSNTVDEGAGFETYIPSGATNIVIETMSRSETGGSGTAALDLYFQTIADNTTPSAWSAGLAMTDITLGADENWQQNSQTIALSTLGATADRFVQFELVRDGGTMANDWTLLYIRISYS